MTLTRRTPLRRKRAKPRRVAARCSVRGCRRPPKVEVASTPKTVNGVDNFVEIDGREIAIVQVAVRLCLTHAKREADRVFAEDVRRVGHCERCGKTTDLQCSHFISRRYLGTRWVRLNAECLCVGCHKFLTERPIEARDRARELLGATVYDELEDRARRFIGPVDYAAIIANGGMA